ncbi:HEPN domain-containing protein [Zunongwangia sp. F363]|uniref:HEPN domain-containing protein n=1 Tax=Autumnicola tepida TaxID=3075595 RepID=A0ABU3C916_9FLAO|nr:HEPN domain-containing protein [Zunongwangia sp. F363]MDT0642829.1 HEPN domain-containing protein [Zunongwangia sp. F363]
MTNYLNLPDQFEFTEKITELTRQILNVLTLDQIYLSKKQTEGESNYYILTGFVDISLDPIPNEVFSLIAEIQKGYPEFRIRIYNEEQADTAMQRGSLYFLEHCSLGTFIYSNPEGENILSYPELSLNGLLVWASRHYNREKRKVDSFEKTGRTLMEDQQFGLAAFNFHQAFEFLFRCIERLCIGKCRVTHSIISHINYCRSFFPQILPFQNSPESKELLVLLEHAYSAGRYEDEYCITKKEIDQILVELKWFCEKVEELYQKHLKNCQSQTKPGSEKEEKTENPEYQNLENATAPEKHHNPHLDFSENAPEITADTNDIIEIRSKLQALLEKKLYRLKKDKLVYRSEFPISGIADVIYTIGGILKVCILASNNAGTSYSRSIPQPNVNIQTVLEHVLELLPYEEMECLEDIIKEYSDLVEPG